MTSSAEAKSTTRQIVISEPDEDELQKGLAGRELSPQLFQFLKNLLRTKKWTRKINIPSTWDNVAAVMVFSSHLKESGLEILSELHVFFDGRSVVEKWEVVGESEKTASLSSVVFNAVDIEKVRVESGQVHVTLRLPLKDGDAKTVVKSFDFSGDGPSTRVVENPFF